jgi:hypothetical protein
VGAILRNDDAEALILDIRTGRTAASQLIGPDEGAFLVFATSVVMPGASSGHLVFPVRCETDPGTLVSSPGTARVAATVAGVAVTGSFSWTVGDDCPPAPDYHFKRRGREIAPPPWAPQLPQSQALDARGPATLTRQQSRLRRQAQNAEHWLLTLTGQLVRHSCRAPIHRALRYRPSTDIDDLVQRSLQVASRLLPLYASSNRPPCSWLGMLRLDGRRDLHREVTHLDWLPADAVAAITLAHACGIDLHGDSTTASKAIAEAADRLRLPALRIGPGQLEATLRAPGLIAHAATVAATVAGPEEDNRDEGRVAETVARLVSTNTDLIALARVGDPRALKRVGDQVIRSLSASGHVTRLARQQAWDDFRQSGQLFTSAAGRQRFGDAAGPATLSIIDDCLRRAAGIYGVATAG